jgi:hypothetical protein
MTCRPTVEIAEDRMRAWIRLAGPCEPQALTPEEIFKAIENAKIAVDDALRDRVKEFITAVTGEGSPPERFLVAEGCPPVEGKNGEFQWHESLERLERDWRGDARVNYYTFNSINTADKDQPIGTLVRAVAGSNGVDVFGKTLAPTGHPKDVELDSTVRLSDDDSTVVLANCAGKVVYEEGKLSISEVLEIKKDVDSETGNIDSPIDVHIGGTILSCFAVRSEKSISVGGAIEAATVDAKGDVIVRGGIIQHDDGSVSSGGDIIAKFCDGARLRAAGNVKVAKELIDSRVHCKEKLLVQSAVVGGQIYAREGAEVAELGNGANVPTELTVGVDLNVLREVDHLRKGLKTKRLAVERIRKTVQPMLAAVKQLSPAQKERATELAFQADEAEAEIAEVESEHTELLDRARATGVPYVLVSKAVHPGVTIRIGHRETTFCEDIKRPVRIEERKVKGDTEFIAIDQLSGSVTVLQSTQVVEQTPVEARGPSQEANAGNG